MLVKLESTDVDRFWPMMKEALEDLDIEQNLDLLLDGLMKDAVQCWLIMDGVEILGFLTTSITEELAGDRSLLIRDLYSLNGVPTEHWKDGQDKLEVFAKQSGCSKLVFFTKNKLVVNRAKVLGYSLSTIYAEKEV